MRTITIWASEVGALAGYSEFRDPTEAAERIWKRSIPWSWSKYEAEHGPSEWHAREQEESKHRFIMDGLLDEYNKPTTPGTRFRRIANAWIPPVPLPRLQRVQRDYIEGLDDPRSVIDYVNRQGMFVVGNDLEYGASLQWARDSGHELTDRQLSKEIGIQSTDYPLSTRMEIVIKGKCDGIVDGCSIYEGKIRINAYNSFIRPSEVAQVQTYMHLMDKNKTHFVQTSRCLRWQYETIIDRDPSYMGRLIRDALSTLSSHRFHMFHEGLSAA